MGMRAVLRAPVTVHVAAVFAEMAWLERRPELALLCARAADQAAPISAALVEGILPGLSSAGARNIVQWCALIGLCDQAGALTPLGREVASTQLAPVPEQGVYALALPDHPLLEGRILAAERLGSSREQRNEDVAPLRPQPERGRVFQSALEPTERFLLRDLPAPSGAISALKLSGEPACELVWTVDFDPPQESWRLEGHLPFKGGNKPIVHSPEPSGLDLEALLTTWARGPLQRFGRWDTFRRWLEIPFAGLKDSQIESFRTSLTLPDVDVLGKGAFRDVRLSDVPLAPQDDRAAQLWAVARLDRALRKAKTPRSRAQVAQLFSAQVRGTPLEHRAPRLPSHEALLGGAAADPELFWSLAAPVDLAPTPLGPDTLGELPLAGIPSTSGGVS